MQTNQKLSSISSIRPLVKRLRSLYTSLPSVELRTAARAVRRAAGTDYRKASGLGQQIELLAGYPPTTVKHDYVRLADLRTNDGRELSAVERIAEAVRVVGHKRLSYTDSDIRDLAAELANRAGGAVGKTKEQVIRAAQAWLPGVTIAGKKTEAQYRRVCDPAFWRRALRKTLWRAIEAAHLSLKLVGGRKGAKYVSNQSVKIKAGQLAKQADWLAASSVETIDEETGEVSTLPLTDLVEKNEKMRLAEFYAWAAGVSELAKADGLIPAMLTLTLEPEWHPNPLYRTTGAWNGQSPAAAHKDMNQRWRQLRASLAQRGIALAGFRAVEPHRDGCPHWHLLVYFLPQNQNVIIEEVLKLWPGKLRVRRRAAVQKADIETYYDAPADAVGAGRAAVKKGEGAQAELSIINDAVASVVTYVTKYVMKQRTNDRAAAWRSCWNIRGIQWVGVRNAFSVWRQLRKVSEKRMLQQGVERALWNRARNGEVAEFLKLLGGLAAAPAHAVVKARGAWESRENKYGETGRRLIGVVLEAVGQVAVFIKTRFKNWVLKTEWPKKCNENMGITVNQSYPSKTKKPKKQSKKSNLVRKKLDGGLPLLTVGAVT